MVVHSIFKCPVIAQDYNNGEILIQDRFVSKSQVISTIISGIKKKDLGSELEVFLENSLTSNICEVFYSFYPFEEENTVLDCIVIQNNGFLSFITIDKYKNASIRIVYKTNIKIVYEMNHNYIIFKSLTDSSDWFFYMKKDNYDILYKILGGI